MMEWLFRFLTGIPDSEKWDFDFNTDDTLRQRLALKKAAKDLGVRIKFAAPRGGHICMIGVFIERSLDGKKVWGLSDRRYEILEGRWEPRPPTESA